MYIATPSVSDQCTYNATLEWQYPFVCAVSAANVQPSPKNTMVVFLDLGSKHLILSVFDLD